MWQNTISLGAVVDLGIVGALLAVLTIIFGQLGCQFTRPTLLGRLTSRLSGR